MVQSVSRRAIIAIIGMALVMLGSCRKPPDRDMTEAQRQSNLALAETAFSDVDAMVNTARIYPPYRILISRYLAAADDRLQGRFEKAGQDYNAALDQAQVILASGQSDQDKAVWLMPEWLMRLYEGRAYSEMQAGDLTRAEDDVQLALSMTSGRMTGRNFVFARLTELKLSCRRGVNPQLIASSLAKLRADFKSIYDSHPSGDPDRRFSALDRTYIETDSELYQLCAAANLAPDATVIAAGGR